MNRKSCVVLAALSLIGCKVGPNYTKPAAPAPPAFKEPPPESFKEWKQAHPNDDAIRGKWWEMYNDPALNALEDQVNISNQNVLVAEAHYREAHAAIAVARSSLFPTITAAPGITVSNGSKNLGAGQVSSFSTSVGGAGGTRTSYLLPFEASYTADIWGAIRRNITSAVATSQANAALLEDARLTYQTMLAEDY